MSFMTRARDALKQHGGRLTDQRKLIIHLLENSLQQIDAESLYALALHEDASMSLATVYRTLNALADAGILQRRYLSPEHTRQYFERMPDDHVIYLTCRECQQSYPVEINLIARLREEITAAYGWDTLSVCSCVSGICPTCQTKTAQTEGDIVV